MKNKVSLYATLSILGMAGLLGLSFKNMTSLNAVKPVLLTKNATDERAGRADLKFDNIEFAVNSASLGNDDYAQLDEITAKLKATKAALKISGFADSKGPYVYNWKLSEKRAIAVKAYLVKKGADSTRIATTEYGETKPIASNATPEGRQRNRRVEFEGF